MNAGADLPALDAIRALAPEMLATRHQIHANPELGFEEFKTSDLVAERLARWGCARCTAAWAARAWWARGWWAGPGRRWPAAIPWS